MVCKDTEHSWGSCFVTTLNIGGSFLYMVVVHGVLENRDCLWNVSDAASVARKPNLPGKISSCGAEAPFSAILVHQPPSMISIDCWRICSGDILQYSPHLYRSLRYWDIFGQANHLNITWYLEVDTIFWVHVTYTCPYNSTVHFEESKRTEVN